MDDRSNMTDFSLDEAEENGSKIKINNNTISEKTKSQKPYNYREFSQHSENICENNNSII